jgi:hypothetical protein
MSYPNERFLKPIYLTTILFSAVLIVSLIVLRTAFPDWSLFPKIIFLCIIIIDIFALILTFILRIRERSKRIKML